MRQGESLESRVREQRHVRAAQAHAAGLAGGSPFRCHNGPTLPNSIPDRRIDRGLAVPEPDVQVSGGLLETVLGLARANRPNPAPCAARGRLGGGDARWHGSSADRRGRAGGGGGRSREENPVGDHLAYVSQRPVTNRFGRRRNRALHSAGRLFGGRPGESRNPERGEHSASRKTQPQPTPDASPVTPESRLGTRNLAGRLHPELPRHHRPGGPTGDRSGACVPRHREMSGRRRRKLRRLARMPLVTVLGRIDLNRRQAVVPTAALEEIRCPRLLHATLYASFVPNVMRGEVFGAHSHCSTATDPAAPPQRR